MLNTTGGQIDNAAYIQRMRRILYWRRVTYIVCLLLVIDALLTTYRDPAIRNLSNFVLLQSVFAFLIAIVVAINYITIRARK